MPLTTQIGRCTLSAGALITIYGCRAKMFVFEIKIINEGAGTKFQFFGGLCKHSVLLGQTSMINKQCSSILIPAKFIL